VARSDIPRSGLRNYPRRFGGWVRDPLRRVSALWASPVSRLPEDPGFIAHLGRELTGSQSARPKLFEEIPSKNPTSMLGRVRVHDPDSQAQTVPGKLDGKLEICIVRDGMATSQSFSNASRSKNVARLTSEPFSSVFTTSATLGPTAGGSARGILTRWERNCPR
jgi:hypothetical protein